MALHLPLIALVRSKLYIGHRRPLFVVLLVCESQSGSEGEGEE